MTDKPILFSGPMVRALLEGRKTQTRRVLPVQPSFDEVAEMQIGGATCDPVAFPDRPYVWLNGWDGSVVGPIINPPRIIQGDRLYVREAWRTGMHIDNRAPRDIMPFVTVFYESDGEFIRGGNRLSKALNQDELGKFRQAMHMPRWASRLTLLVTDVRVQRLPEISEQDAIAEGCKGYVSNDGEDGESPIEEFQALWNTLNTERGYGWATNPWVVAYSFEVIKSNIDQIEQVA